MKLAFSTMSKSGLRSFRWGQLPQRHDRLRTWLKLVLCQSGLLQSGPSTAQNRWRGNRLSLRNVVVSVCSGIRDYFVQEAVQALAESRGNFEDPFVPSDHEHLSRAVVNRRAAAATAQMPLNLLAHLDRGVSVHVLGEVGDYSFAANHGFDPFQRSQTETFGFAKLGVSASRSMRRARCSRVLTST